MTINNMETQHLQSTDANKARLEESMQQAQEGKLLKQPTNIDKASKEALKSIIVGQNSRIAMLENTLTELEEFNTVSGINLTLEPFIPEYLGFANKTVDMEDGSVLRLYERDNFLLLRDGDKWIINVLESFKTVHTIDNMLEGTVVLRSLGLDVSILDVVCGKFVEVE